MPWCRASLAAEDADGTRVGSWDSPLPEDADNHVEHLVHLAGVIDENVDVLSAAEGVGLFLTVERGGGGAVALTIPAEVITSLARVGGFLWIDAHQETED